MRRMDYVNEHQIKLVDEYFKGSGAKVRKISFEAYLRS